MFKMLLEGYKAVVSVVEMKAGFYYVAVRDFDGEWHVHTCATKMMAWTAVKVAQITTKTKCNSRVGVLQDGELLFSADRSGPEHWDTVVRDAQLQEAYKKYSSRRV